MSYLFTSTVRMLTNYFPGIRTSYHKLFERARNLQLLIVMVAEKVNRNIAKCNDAFNGLSFNIDDA